MLRDDPDPSVTIAWVRFGDVFDMVVKGFDKKPRRRQERRE